MMIVLFYLSFIFLTLGTVHSANAFALVPIQRARTDTIGRMANRISQERNGAAR